MRKVIALLLASASMFVLQPQANSADFPTKARVAQGAPVWSWNGLYIGAHVGGGWGTIESEFAAVPFPIASGTVNGFLGGGQIGYNFQSGIIVIGVEADASFSGIKGTTPCLFFSCKREVEAFGTVTGRVGVTADRALIYVKGGAAWVHTKYNVSIFGAPAASADKTVWGWTVGTGVEYAVTSNWSAKIEYNFMDFAKETVNFNIGGLGTVGVNSTQYLHTMKFGVNYRFGAGALMARY